MFRAGCHHDGIKKAMTIRSPLRAKVRLSREDGRSSAVIATVPATPQADEGHRAGGAQFQERVHDRECRPSLTVPGSCGSPRTPPILQSDLQQRRCCSPSAVRCSSATSAEPPTGMVPSGERANNLFRAAGMSPIGYSPVAHWRNSGYERAADQGDGSQLEPPFEALNEASLRNMMILGIVGRDGG